MAIQGFKDDRAKAIFDGLSPGKGFPANLLRAAKRKLEMLDAAVSLNDLRAPPGNRLEALSGNRLGQHSIRVNDQFRLVFVWTTAGPVDVMFVDYHWRRRDPCRMTPTLSPRFIPARFCLRSSSSPTA